VLAVNVDPMSEGFNNLQLNSLRLRQSKWRINVREIYKSPKRGWRAMTDPLEGEYRSARFTHHGRSLALSFSHGPLLVLGHPHVPARRLPSTAGLRRAHAWRLFSVAGDGGFPSLSHANLVLLHPTTTAVVAVCLLETAANAVPVPSLLVVSPPSLARPLFASPVARAPQPQPQHEVAYRVLVPLLYCTAVRFSG